MPNARVSAPTRVQSVERAAQVLITVASMPESERTVKGLVKALGTTVPTMYHLLNTLVDVRLLTRDEHRRYHLGVTVGYLASAYYSQQRVSEELVGPLRGLTESTGETAYLSGWRDGDLEILAQMSGTRAVRVMDLGPGYHGGAHARASGKVLLAFASLEQRQRYLDRHPLRKLTPRTMTNPTSFARELQRVATRGFASEEEEFSEGVACLSVPITDGPILLGAYTISAPIDRYRRMREEYLSHLRIAARMAVARPAGEDGDISRGENEFPVPAASTG